MYLAGDVINEINTMFPNNHTVAALLRKVDTFQKSLYRAAKRQNRYSVELVINQPEYTLPMPQHSILQVDIRDARTQRFSRLPLRQASDLYADRRQPYYYFLSDPALGEQIGIYPIPDGTRDYAMIFHHEVPATVDSVDSPITIPDIFFMALVYGPCAEIAGSISAAGSMADRFLALYRELESDFVGLGKRSDVLTVRNEMGW